MRCARALFSLAATIGARSERSFGRHTRQSPEIVDPWCGRAAPDLPCGPEPTTLAYTAPADPEIIGPTLAAGEQRRATVAAEMLVAGVAVVAALSVHPRRRAGQMDVLRGADHGYAIGRAGQRLAVRAMADRYLHRVDFGLVGHASAMALPVDPHRRTPKKKRRPKAPLSHFLFRLSAPSDRRKPRLPP